jgi:phosphoribosylamine--glycine ligase
MRVLVVGGGAREHCIASVLGRDDVQLYTVMRNKNPGLAALSEEYYLNPETEVDKVCEWTGSKGIEMAVIGPEAPLEAGLVDRLAEAGIPSVGPTMSCARLETSKSFTRDLLAKYGIPGNPEFRIFASPYGLKDYIEELGEYVVKDEGLCGGKGVKLSGEHLASVEEGAEYAKQCIIKSGAVVVEEKFVGEEFSLQCLTDGKTVVGSPLAQDHKRAFEGDKGPNTGGMGSYSDADHLLPFLDESDHDDALSITRRVCKALREECGEPYKGVMYGGFIATRDGVRLVEFNARYGDPEVMNVLTLLETSLLDMFQAVVDGTLSEGMARYSNKATVCKYVVPKGYGIKSEANFQLEVDTGAIEQAGSRLYYAAVDERDGQLFTTSSRSLGIVGIGDDLGDAEAKAERALAHVKGNVFMRHDIGTEEAIERKVRRMRYLRGVA